MKKELIIPVFLLAMVFFVSVPVSSAAVPQTINYQGYLTDTGGAPLTGTYSMVFSICDAASGGSCPWTETQSVSVDKGVFNVILGSVTPITLAFDIQYYLDIQVGGEQMTTRQPLTSVGYAFRANEADGVAAGSITNASISGSAAIDVSKISGLGSLATKNTITDADVDAAAGIQDSKLATISTAGKVANSATTATAPNTANTIVLRDASGNFSAGTITANLTGNVTGNLSGNAATVTNGVYTNTANTFSTGAQTMNTGAAGTKGLIVKGVASQTANLQEWQNSSGSAVASVNASGVFTGNGSGLTNLPGASPALIYSGGTLDAQSGVNYHSANGESSPSTLSDSQINLVPISCTAKNFYVTVLHYQGGDGGSYVVTLMKGTTGLPAATTLTCTVANTGGSGTINTCNDTTHTVSFSPGNFVSIKVDGSSASYSGGYGPDMAWGFTCQ